MSVSVENKTIARYALTAFGGIPNVQAYYHNTEPLSIDLLRCENRPCGGVTSYSTIGLSDYPMFREDDTEFPTRLEIAGACATTFHSFANILASAAFSIMRTQKLYCPGSVLPGYVREYFPSTPVPHLYFTAPFLWEDSLRTLEFGTMSVSWLLAMPISDTELGFLQKHDGKTLEALFEKHQIDIFDLDRTSVV